VAFDTVPNQWATIELPFDRFLPVIRNRVNYKAPGLGGNPTKKRVATSFGIVYRCVWGGIWDGGEKEGKGTWLTFFGSSTGVCAGRCW
jgi:hypothetical protein